ncbi:hypothetical protein VTJ04DRAFT_9060 [Mycothermus thermophilus]|uniref:uncharacterized protein n=1 Tax=Humicola insolens TaxID=85995 RepID=UPI00374473A3
MATLIFLTLNLIIPVLANTEKAIFLGPDPAAADVSPVPPELSNIHLDTLTPRDFTHRTRLPAVFPSLENPKGKATWVLLDGLTPGQRYEVRVCWPATQPTTFTLTPYSPSTVYSTPDLLSSLLNYTASYNHRQQHQPLPPRTTNPSGTQLLLQILAAADFFTTNTTLMLHPPPVDADIILDPFLFNVLPRSLAGTVGYLVFVAVVAYFGVVRVVKGVIAELVRSGVEADGEGKKKKVQ